MAFALYFPNCATGSAATLREAGLESFCENAPRAVWQRMVEGPDGNSGAACSFGLRVDVQALEWTETPGYVGGGVDLAEGRFWIGHHDVMPQELARPQQLVSTSVALDGEREWLMPRASELPWRIEIDRQTGEFKTPVQEEYRPYHDAATQMMNAYIGHSCASTLDVIDVWKFAVSGLALNYLLTLETVSVLNIVGTDQNLFWLAGAAFELQLVGELAADGRLPIDGAR